VARAALQEGSIHRRRHILKVFLQKEKALTVSYFSMFPKINCSKLYSSIELLSIDDMSKVAAIDQSSQRRQSMAE
jgi:hypothetical protein